MYLITLSSSDIPASSRSLIIFSVEMSIIDAVSGDAMRSMMFLRYHTKSVTNWVSSLPCDAISSMMPTHPRVSRLIMPLKSLLKTSVSTAPRTSSVWSYESSPSDWKALA